MKQELKKRVIKIFFLLVLITSVNSTAQNFRTVWRTTTPNESITIEGYFLDAYDYSVDWGDGNSEVGNSTVFSHSYVTAGDYTVTISGNFPRIYFNNSGDKNKIISIEEWGSSITWTSLENAFYGCENLVNNAVDVPVMTGSFTSFASMFKNCTKIGTGSANNWGSWGTSKVTNTSEMFSGTAFNEDIGNWNVTNVSNMTNMFLGVTLAPYNYDSILTSWNAQTLQNNVVFSAGSSKYCSQAAEDARANMIATNNWTFTDGGKNNATTVNWTGTKSSSWKNSKNWDSCVPISTQDVNISLNNSTNLPYINNVSELTVKNLNFTSTKTSSSVILIHGALTINNDLSITSGKYLNVAINGSLIILGNVPQGVSNANLLKVDLRDSDRKWRLMSSPVLGEEYNDAWNLESTINISGNNNNTGIGIYSNLLGTKGEWNYFKNGSATQTFASGKGYALLKKVGGNIYFRFTGTYQDEDVIQKIDRGFGGANGWNLVGNPYPSYLKVSELITANSLNLTDTHRFVYVWDNSLNSGAGAYKTLLGTDYIHPGQGFFVNASNSNDDNFTITESLQSHQTNVTFYKNSNPSIKLMITDGSNFKFTEIVYENNSTTDLDPSFDAGTFTGTSTSFSLYSHLVSNSEGVDFMRQSLPKDNYENMVIPLGFNADTGKEITFSADVNNLPADIKLYLEDRNTNTFSRLDEVNSTYKLTLTEASNGIGRFYLHTKSSTLSTNDVLLENISIYKTNNVNLRITGLSGGQSKVSLFNILGKKVMNTSFNSNGVQDVLLPKLTAGVYIVQLKTEKGHLNKKITLE